MKNEALARQALANTYTQAGLSLSGGLSVSLSFCKRRATFATLGARCSGWPTRQVRNRYMYFLSTFYI
jgi:hypothetical protein